MYTPTLPVKWIISVFHKVQGVLTLSYNINSFYIKKLKKILLTLSKMSLKKEKKKKMPTTDFILSGEILKVFHLISGTRYVCML